MVAPFGTSGLEHKNYTIKTIISVLPKENFFGHNLFTDLVLFLQKKYRLKYCGKVFSVHSRLFGDDLYRLFYARK